MIDEFAFDNTEERRKNRQNGVGWIEVIVGSMFSGKSEELIRRLNRARIARQKVQVFKPKIDARYSVEEIASHSGQKHDSKPVTTAAELMAEISPETQVVGCWPENSDVMLRCMQAGEIRDFPYQTTWSTSTAGGVEPNAITLELCRRVIDRSVLVTENEILAAARQIWRDENQLVEGAAAVAVAAFTKTSADYAGKTVAIVICGGNANPDFESRIRQD